MRTWAAISLAMLLDPGAIAAPMKETVELPTRMIFLAWNTSDVEDRMGARTAWTSDSALGTQVWVAVASRLSPMSSSYISLAFS